MARTYKSKNVHGKPSLAGEKNMKDVKMAEDESGIMPTLLEIWEKGKPNIYKGQWTAEELSDSISEYFQFCRDRDFKPTKPSLSVWLGIDKSTLWEWEHKPEKYGEKSTIVKYAMAIMESYLQADINKYPTGNIFLLKTSHGHVESSKLDVTTNGKDVNDAEDVKALVEKLGLNK